MASINGMQVKDYLQALSDENRIRVEKIGSGNWYWSFPSDEKMAKEAALEKAQEEHDKATAIVKDLQAKVDGAGAAREDDGDIPAGIGTPTTNLETDDLLMIRRSQDPHQQACGLEERSRGFTQRASRIQRMRSSRDGQKEARDSAGQERIGEIH